MADDQHDPIEWISATRHRREMYAVNGSNGELGFKIGQNDFPEKLFTSYLFLNTNARRMSLSSSSQKNDGATAIKTEDKDVSI